MRCEPNRSVATALSTLALPYGIHAALLACLFGWERHALGHASLAGLAAFQIGSVVVYNLTSILSAGSIGILAVVGRALGRKDHEGALRAAAAGIVLAALLGLLCATPVWLTRATWVGLLAPASSEIVRGEAVRYLGIVLPVLPLLLVEATIASSFRAAGNARTPLRVALLGTSVNVVVVSWLLFGARRMGVGALALGTVAGTAMQLVAYAGIAWGRAAGPVRLTWLDVVAASREIVAPGAVVIGDRAIECAGFTLFVVAVGRLGDTAMAANQAVIAVEACGMVVVDAVGIAVAALVARASAARSSSERSKVIGVGLGGATAMLVVVATVVVVAPTTFLSIFSSDPTVVAAGAPALVVAGATLPLVAYASVTKMAMRGDGAPRRALLLGVVGTIAVRVPLTLWLGDPARLGLVGAWIACAADWAAQAILAVHWVRGSQARDVLGPRRVSPIDAMVG